tara:strand:- start:202 stop:921 length:720 start_codon:yes stop_codon:yes gene_type:complete
MKKNELDILIPVFNEDETIIETIKNILSAVNLDYRILVCYDYEEDPTLEIIKKNFPDNAKILFIKNFSKGFNSAIISGFQNSSAKAIVVFMADDHTNHNLINLCYEKYSEGYDLVCPSRFVKGGKMIGNPFLKALLTRLVSFFLFYFTTFPIKDPTNSFRLFSKKLINNVKIESDKGFTLSLELAAKAHRLGYKMIEIPTIWKERNKGKSRFRLFSFIPPYLKWFFYIIKTSFFKKNEK